MRYASCETVAESSAPQQYGCSHGIGRDVLYDSPHTTVARIPYGTLYTKRRDHPCLPPVGKTPNAVSYLRIYRTVCDKPPPLLRNLQPIPLAGISHATTAVNAVGRDGSQIHQVPSNLSSVVRTVEACIPE